MAAQHPISPESPFALLSPAERRAWYAYMKVQLRLRYEMNRQLQADSGISLADYDVLVALVSDPEGTLTMSSLAVRIGWERSRASHHVRRMAERGLVATAPAPDDRRITHVSLTAEGRSTLADASPAHVALVRQVFFDGLDADRVEVLAASFEEVYDRLIEHGTLPRPEDHP